MKPGLPAVIYDCPENEFHGYTYNLYDPGCLFVTGSEKISGNYPTFAVQQFF